MSGCSGSSTQVFGTVCRLSCRHGYQPSTTLLRKCQENGTWIGKDIVCFGKGYSEGITARYNKIILKGVLFREPYCFISRRIVSCSIVSYRVTVRVTVSSCRIVSCHVTSCHVVPYRAVSCHVASFPIVSCRVIVWGRTMSHCVLRHIVSSCSSY
jgi:hypothetical protein